MADRSIKVVLRAQVDGYKRAMRDAADSTEKVALTADTAGGRLVEFATKNEQAAQSVGTALTTVGTATTAAMAGAVKAAIDWESAWTGVTKTVDGTPAQLAEVESGLRELARTLPATHAEIAGVAEAAGQLGVARDDVVGFTRTMIDLGESTNLTAEEAATSIAQISNVMGTMEREGAEGAERFGSALVALGNNGASTEAEILSMAQRIAGAGATVGATEADVLALSNTLASMGVRAELGGGVATRVLLRMRTAVDESGDALATFAETAGLSAEEFAAKFRSAPMEALQLVAQGVNDVNEAGGNVTATLEEMGVKGTEETQVMLALANSGSLLTESLELGAAAWEQNSALAEEAEKRYETAASRIQIAWNTIKDAAITVGGAVLPVVAGLADAAANVADAFAGLPEPMQQAAGTISALAGAASLAGGAFLVLAPRALQVYGAFKDLGAVSPRVARGVGDIGHGLGRVAGAAAGIGAVAAALQLIDGATRKAQPGVDEVANRLVGVAESGDDISKVFAGISSFDPAGLSALSSVPETADEWGALLDQIDAMDSGIGKVQSQIGGLFGWNDDLEAWEGQFEKVGQSIATMATEDVPRAQATFSKFVEAMGGGEEVTRRLLDLMPAYKDQLSAIATEQGISLDNAQLLAVATGEMSISTDTATGSVRDQTQALQYNAEAQQDAIDMMLEAANAALAQSDAEIGLEQAIDDATKTIKDNGETLDVNTKKGRDNQTALNRLADAGWKYIEQQKSQGASEKDLTRTMERTRRKFIDNAKQAGLTGKEARDLADDYGLIPERVNTDIDAKNKTGKPTRDAKGNLNSIPNRVGVDIVANTRGFAGARAEVNSIRTYVGVDVEARPRGFAGIGLASGGLIGFAEGGMVPGTPPGDPGADNILARTQRGTPYAIRSGEFIQSQPAVEHYGADFMAALNARRVPKESLQGFAGGGRVPGAYAAAGAPSSPPTVNVAPPSLNGVRVVLDVDGRSITGVMREVVSANNAAQDSRARYARGGV